MKFKRMKVRMKREIVKMGVEGIDKLKSVGKYIKKKEWKEIIEEEKKVVVDKRNDYEYEIGNLEGEIDKKKRNFREFKEWVKKKRERMEGKKIEML